MTDSPGPRIVVGVDGSLGGDAALRWAVREAPRHDASVDAVYAIPDRTPSAEDPEGVWDAVALAEARRALRRAVGRAWTEAVPLTQTVRRSGPAAALHAAAEDPRTVMVVIGRRQDHWRAALRPGALGHRLASTLDVPLVVVPQGLEDRDHRPITRIVVGVDGSPGSRSALHWAVDEARTHGALVEVVLAWSMHHVELLPFVPPHRASEPAVHRRARQTLDTEIATVGRDDVDLDARTVHGETTDVLLNRAVGADLLVVGTSRHDAVHRHLVGSTSHALLGRAPGVLVIVPPERPAAPTAAADTASVARPAPTMVPRRGDADVPVP